MIQRGIGEGMNREEFKDRAVKLYSVAKTVILDNGASFYWPAGFNYIMDSDTVIIGANTSDYNDRNMRLNYQMRLVVKYQNIVDVV